MRVLLGMCACLQAPVRDKQSVNWWSQLTLTQVWLSPCMAFTRYDHCLLCCLITYVPAGRLPSTGWQCCFRVTHPAGPSCRPPVGSAGSGERWTEAGGEISSPGAAPGGTPTGRLGGTSCRPAGRRDAAAPLWNKNKCIHVEVSISSNGGHLKIKTMDVIP